MSFQEHCSEVVKALKKVGIVPVLALESVDDGLKMCEVLTANGLPAAEITFRTAAAEAVIAAASKRFPEMYLGAGTVLNVTDLKRAFDAGARFAVAPGFNPTVVKEAVRQELPFAPGICTPSEIEQACELGCRFLKFFPAEASGGIKMLSSLIAPYRHLGITFMPTGGVTAANAAEYLALKEVVAVGGTWLGKSSDVAAGEWEKIAGLIRDAAGIAARCSR